MKGFEDNRRQLIAALESIRPEEVESAASIIIASLRAGGRVLACGNGGSAAQAQHFCAELTCSYRDRNRQPLPAIALHTDTSALTAYANDFGYDGFYERVVRAHCGPNDVLVAISTSGYSKNVRLAIEAAREKGAHVIFLTGGFPTKCADTTLHIKINSLTTPRIQECHEFILHEIAGLVEDAFSRPGAPILSRAADPQTDAPGSAAPATPTS